ncbi:MAG: MATE family efflux transporter [Eubacteriales bacterium]
MDQSQKQNKMGVMPVGKLLFTMSLPMIISMMIQALYNVVDSIFVNMISTEAFDAVSIAFPVQNLMIGVATGTAVGVNALLSKALGEKDRERANRVADNGVFLALVGYLIFLIFGIFFARPYFQLYANKVTPATLEYGVTYISICSILSFGVFGQIMFERLMQSTGKTIFTLFTQGIGAIINIIADPILIFGLLGLPKMGVAGAALATVLGQMIAFLLAVFFNHKYNGEIRLSLRSFRPDGGMIRRIYAIGVPSIIMVGIGSVMTFSMNQILGTLKQTAITVFGAYFKIQSFIFMPVFGLNNGVIPIIAYNYGAGKRRRMMKTMRLAICTACSFMAVGFLAMQLIPDRLLSILVTENSPADLLTTGVPALRIISLSFLLAGVCIVFSSVFQALGHGFLSMFVSLARQLLVLVPAAYLFSLSGNVDLVWWAFPIAEIASVAVSVSGFLYLYKKIIVHIPE